MRLVTRDRRSRVLAAARVLRRLKREIRVSFALIARTSLLFGRFLFTIAFKDRSPNKQLCKGATEIHNRTKSIRWPLGETRGFLDEVRPVDRALRRSACPTLSSTENGNKGRRKKCDGETAKNRIRGFALIVAVCFRFFRI